MWQLSGTTQEGETHNGVVDAFSEDWGSAADSVYDEAEG